MAHARRAGPRGLRVSGGCGRRFDSAGDAVGCGGARERGAVAARGDRGAAGARTRGHGGAARGAGHDDARCALRRCDGAGRHGLQRERAPLRGGAASARGGQACDRRVSARFDRGRGAGALCLGPRAGAGTALRADRALVGAASSDEAGARGSRGRADAVTLHRAALSVGGRRGGGGALGAACDRAAACAARPLRAAGARRRAV